jgi:imidazolonepropionase-like amidohydrolase
VTYDLGDVTLLPGLIDAHTHLGGGEELTPSEELLQTDARYAVEGVANARKTLLAGFTTVRDPRQSRLRRRGRARCHRRGHIPGPRMLVAVSSLSATGGHGDENELPFDIKVDRYSAIADGPDEIRHKVAREHQVRRGLDQRLGRRVGVRLTANTVPDRWPTYTEEEIRRWRSMWAREKASATFAVHAHGAEGIKACNAGSG